MIKDFKGVLVLKRANIITTAAIMVGMVLLAVVLGLILDIDELGIGNFIAIIVSTGYVFLNMFIRLMFMADETPRGLAFGITRRSLFLNSRIYDLLELAVVVLIVAISWQGADLGLLIKAAVLIYGIFMLVEGTGGNAVVRYGKTAYWVYYIIFLVFCLGFPRLMSMVRSVGEFMNKSFDALFKNPYTQTSSWIGILVFVAIAMAINWITFRKIPVNANV